MVPILKMEKQRCREFKSLARWHSWKVVQRTQKPRSSDSRTCNTRLFSTRARRSLWKDIFGGQVNSEKETEREQSERYILTQMCFWHEDYKYTPHQMVLKESIE